jgi:hypothetical protein
VQDAVAAVTARLRFHPHHIEARRCELDGVDKKIAKDLSPGDARRVP